MKKLLLSILLALGVLGFSLPASAQSCSVTISATTSNTSSTTCYVPPNGQAYVQLTGTWTGPVVIEYSNNNGNAYATQYKASAIGSYTLPVVNRPRLWRVTFGPASAATTGTLTGSIAFNAPTLTRLTYATVPIGSVAYASMGASVSVAFSTSLEVADLVVDSPFYSTGCGVLVGATTGTNTVICQLYDATGKEVANTAVAGVTTGTANAFQQIPWTTITTFPAGHYYLAVQLNGTTDKYRAVAASTFLNVVGAEIAGSAFGTLTPVISPPTTFTASKPPIGYVY